MLGFGELHPFVLFLYFLSVLIITMFSANPILMIIALLGGVLFFVKTEKKLSFLKDFGFYLVMLLLVALTNPLFSHKGVTVLFFLNNNPVTLESFLYGLNLGVTLVAVIFWFKSFNIVMTSEKLLFLMGRISPKIALIISSALRFIPTLKKQYKKIKESQTSLGRFSNDSWFDKIKGNLQIFSALISWSFENAIDTGASMKARGYELKGKSRYSLFRFKKSDLTVLIGVLTLDVLLVVAFVMGKNDFSFYPALSRLELGAIAILMYISFFMLSFLPFVLELWGSIIWKYYKSKIRN